MNQETTACYGIGCLKHAKCAHWHAAEGAPEFTQGTCRDYEGKLPMFVEVDRPCKKCGGEMRDGQAIQQTFTGIEDFHGAEIVTMSPGGPGRLIDCKKCADCGWSVSA